MPPSRKDDNQVEILPLYQLHQINSSSSSPTNSSSDSYFKPSKTFKKSNESPLKPHSLSQLSKEDKKNFFILVLLYFLQGIPVGLAFGSIPFILKSYLSYTQVGIFTLASYPYSMKLLWSPIVDAFYNKSFGRRKSWIVPIQTVSSFVLLYLSSKTEELFKHAEKNLWIITSAFFTLVFLCATQDIAVDGWALTLLSKESLSYAATAQTVGINMGYFLSFTVFLAFNSPEFSNKYIRKVPLDEPLISLSGYLKFCGCIYLFTTIFVAIFVKENPEFIPIKKTDDDDNNQSSGIIEFEEGDPVSGVLQVYKTMINVIKLKNVQQFILIHIIAKIGFQANEGVTNLKLLEKGFSKEDLAVTVLIDFPFEIIFGYYAAKWSIGSNPLKPWLYGFLGRILSAVLAHIIIMFFPSDGKVTKLYFLMVILQHILGSFMSTVQFVSINAFHTKIADPAIGGTYMTTLNTIMNLGGQWPRIIVFHLVDYFTVATCSPPSTSPASNIFETFSCATHAGKEQCNTLNGTCTTYRDGYYVTSIICITIGLTLFFTYIKRKILELQRIPTAQWRVKSD